MRRNAWKAFGSLIAVCALAVLFSVELLNALKASMW